MEHAKTLLKMFKLLVLPKRPPALSKANAMIALAKALGLQTTHVCGLAGFEIFAIAHICTRSAQKSRLQTGALDEIAASLLMSRHGSCMPDVF